MKIQKTKNEIGRVVLFCTLTGTSGVNSISSDSINIDMLKDMLKNRDELSVLEKVNNHQLNSCREITVDSFHIDYLAVSLS
jgi:hypothetical protein